MDIREFISKIEKLYFYEYTSNYILDKVRQQKQRFLQLLQELDREGYKFLEDSENTIVDRIEYLYNSVLRSISYFFKGDYSESRDIIYETFFDYFNSQRVPLRAKSINSGASFFRIRENDTYNVFERKEMFHIPFDCAETAKNQRAKALGNNKFLFQIAAPPMQKAPDRSGKEKTAEGRARRERKRHPRAKLYGRNEQNTANAGSSAEKTHDKKTCDKKNCHILMLP